MDEIRDLTGEIKEAIKQITEIHRRMENSNTEQAKRLFSTTLEELRRYAGWIEDMKEINDKDPLVINNINAFITADHAWKELKKEHPSLFS